MCSFFSFERRTTSIASRRAYNSALKILAACRCLYVATLASKGMYVSIKGVSIAVCFQLGVLVKCVGIIER